MKTELLERFENMPYFTLRGFMQVSGATEDEIQRVRMLLSRWKQSGRILALKRGVYMTRRFFELHRTDPDFAAAVSSILLPQSYVSLEYRLQRAGVLTEATYPVTCVTTKNTRSFENDIGTFAFRHIQPELYTGFEQKPYYGLIYHIASISKALFDYLYLRPLPRPLRARDLDLAEDLRLNLDEFDTGEQQEFAVYVKECGSEKMDYILNNLRRTVWRQ